MFFQSVLEYIFSGYNSPKEIYCIINRYYYGVE